MPHLGYLALGAQGLAESRIKKGGLPREAWDIANKWLDKMMEETQEKARATYVGRSHLDARRAPYGGALMCKGGVIDAL